MSTPRAVALLLAALAAAPVHAWQPAASAPPPAIDPAAPLPPLPDLGVEWPTADAPAAAQTAPAAPADALVSYRVRERGLAEVGAEDEFRALSALRAQKEPANLAQIEVRARTDAALADRLLRARGYYAATAAYTIEPAPAAGGEATVTLTVTPGARYAFAAVDVAVPAGGPRDLVARELGFGAGAPVDAARVIAAEERVRLALPRRGYPFATVAPPAIVIDHDRRVARYQIAVDPGPLTRFGAIRTSGRPDLGAEHLQVIARFSPGETWDQALVDDFRRALIATSLFAQVDVAPARAAPGVADVAVTVAPAPPRTIAGEIGYDTEDGARVEASWRHRNLIPPEGAVTFRAIAGQREQAVSAELIRSNWRRRDQLVAARLDVGAQDTDAYSSRGVTAAARVERRTTLLWQKPWTYSYGVELIASQERDRGRFTGRTREFFLVAFPGTLGYDGSDDLLDPQRGFRLAGRLSPEISVQGDFQYLRARVDASAYVPLGGRTVAAGRLALGAIGGAARDTIAPSRRWYVGGGGSVRGYGYQDIGPKDADGDPLGGRSFTELAAEARVRVTDTIGVVPFLDAGALYTSSYPRLGDFQYGAGLGVRYYSAFGPIRFDVARPLNGRRGDPEVAVYVSIGQAF